MSLSPQRNFTNIQKMQFQVNEKSRFSFSGEIQQCTCIYFRRLLYSENCGKLMYFTDDVIRRAEEQYGQPRILRLHYPTPRRHYDFIRSTQKNDRCHDITLYIWHEYRLAVTRKPVYPAGVYRPSSGGLNPGESLEEGAAREAWEEMGIRIRLERYLLRARVDFIYGLKRIRWTTHVFQARGEGTDFPNLAPKDLHEIVEAEWVNESEFFRRIRRGLLSVDSTGLLYRVHLHDVLWRMYGWGKVNE